MLNRATPGAGTRTVVDDRGVEWEVHDEAMWSIGLAIEWDHFPQRENPGLIFLSRAERRRLWPRPEGWSELPSEALTALLQSARPL